MQTEKDVAEMKEAIKDYLTKNPFCCFGNDEAIAIALESFLSLRDFNDFIEFLRRV